MSYGGYQRKEPAPCEEYLKGWCPNLRNCVGHNICEKTECTSKYCKYIHAELPEVESWESLREALTVDEGAPTRRDDQQLAHLANFVDERYFEFVSHQVGGEDEVPEAEEEAAAEEEEQAPVVPVEVEEEAPKAEEAPAAAEEGSEAAAPPAPPVKKVIPDDPEVPFSSSVLCTSSHLSKARVAIPGNAPVFAPKMQKQLGFAAPEQQSAPPETSAWAKVRRTVACARVTGVLEAEEGVMFVMPRRVLRSIYQLKGVRSLEHVTQVARRGNRIYLTHHAFGRIAAKAKEKSFEPGLAVENMETRRSGEQQGSRFAATVLLTLGSERILTSGEVDAVKQQDYYEPKQQTIIKLSSGPKHVRIDAAPANLADTFVELKTKRVYSPKQLATYDPEKDRYWTSLYIQPAVLGLKEINYYFVEPDKRNAVKFTLRDKKTFQLANRPPADHNRRLNKVLRVLAELKESVKEGEVYYLLPTEDLGIALVRMVAPPPMEHASNFADLPEWF